MSGSQCFRNGYKMDKHCEITGDAQQRSNKIDIDNEIYIIDSSDEDVPNVESSHLSVERINDIIIGGLDRNYRINAPSSGDDNLETGGKRSNETRSNQNYNGFVYVSDDSYASDSLDRTNINHLDISINCRTGNRLNEKTFNCRIEESSSFNFDYEKLSLTFDREGNSGNINFENHIGYNDISEIPANDQIDITVEFNDPIDTNPCYNVCDFSVTKICTDNSSVNQQLETNDQNVRNQTTSENYSTSNDVNLNTYSEEGKPNVENMCKHKPDKNILKSTKTNNQCTSRSSEQRKIGNSSENKNFNSSNKNVFSSLSAQLHQFERFEQNAMKLCNMNEEWEDNKMQSELDTDENHVKNSMEKANIKKYTCGKTYLSHKNPRINEPVLHSEEKKSDIQIRLNFANGDNGHSINNHQNEINSENEECNIINQVKLNSDEYNNETEKNDIFDYLKLDKRKPMEVEQDLENKKKNKKRRSLRVERLKQIQENAKELLKLRKANEAYEADECPNDLINETLVTVNNKHVSNDMPVLEPIIPLCKISNSFGLKSNDNTLPINGGDNKRELFNSKKKNKTSSVIDKKKYLSLSTDKSSKITSNNDGKDESCTKHLGINKNEKFKAKTYMMQMTSQKRHIDDLCITKHNKSYNQLKDYHPEGLKKQKTERKISKHKSCEERKKIDDLLNKKFGSLEFFDKFSNEVYCDMLEQSPNSNSSFNNMEDDAESTDIFSDNSTNKTTPTRIADLSGEVKLTTNYNHQNKFNEVIVREENGTNFFNAEMTNGNCNTIICDKGNYQNPDKMPCLRKMVSNIEKSNDKNNHEHNKYFNDNIKDNKHHHQPSSTTIVENDEIILETPNLLNSSSSLTSSSLMKRKFYEEICLESKKESEMESLYYVQNNEEDKIESFFIRDEIVIIVRQKTIYFYEHSTGFKFFRSPKLWQYRGSLNRYLNEPEKRLEQITNHVTYTDQVTAYVEVWIKPRKLSSTQNCPVCDMSAVIYHYESSNLPEKSILHLDYAQCSVNNLCFTILPFDRAVIVGYINTLSEKPEFILKKYLIPKKYSSNKDIITLPSVDFMCTSLQAVNADIILGFSTERMVFWHHGYETILQIVNLSSIPKSVCNEDFSYLFHGRSFTQCVWARLDTTCFKRSAMHILMYHSKQRIFVLLIANNQDWSDFKISHVYRLTKSMGSLLSVSVSGCRVVAAFNEGAISYDFPLLPYEIQDEHATEVGNALNVCTYKSSTVYPCGEMLVYYKNNTAVPIFIDQM